MKLPVMIDSGAFTIWRQYMKYHSGNTPTRRQLVKKYLASPEFRTHLQNYVNFLKRGWKDRCDVAATLDIIGDADATYEVWKELRAEGLSLLPVYHIGEPFRWLSKYIDEGCDYIGIGGMAFAFGRGKDAAPFIRSVFKHTPADVRLHGFGMSFYSETTLGRWYSVDGSTPLMAAAHGSVLVPRGLKETAEAYAVPSYVDFAHSRLSKDHIKTQGPTVWRRLEKWFREHGASKAANRLQHDYYWRQVFNYRYVGEYETTLLRQLGRAPLVYTVDNDPTGPRKRHCLGDDRFDWEPECVEHVYERLHLARLAGCPTRMPRYLLAYRPDEVGKIEGKLELLAETVRQHKPKVQRKRLQKENRP